MNEENEEPWSEEQIEEWEHDKWLKMQEMGGEIYDPTLIFSKKRKQRTAPLRKKKEENGRKKKKTQNKPTSRR